MSETVKKPMVSKSVAAGNYFYFTRHKPLRNKEGKEVGMEVVGQKTDVTDSVAHLVEQEIYSFLDYVKEKYNLDLRVPELQVDEDGEKCIHGAKEATGYEYLNDLVDEWRKS